VQRAARVAANIGSRYGRKRGRDTVAEELNDIEFAIGASHRANRKRTTRRPGENSSLKSKRRERSSIELTDIQCTVRTSDAADNCDRKTGCAIGIGRDPGGAGDRNAAGYEAGFAEGLKGYRGKVMMLVLSQDTGALPTSD
jgi:hypothetical protein